MAVRTCVHVCTRMHIEFCFGMVVAVFWGVMAPVGRAVQLGCGWTKTQSDVVDPRLSLMRWAQDSV